MVCRTREAQEAVRMGSAVWWANPAKGKATIAVL